MKLFAYTVIAGSLLLGSGVPTSAQQAESPFEAVPREHWVYTTLDQFERADVSTGYPEGTFRGKRLLTRYEVALAVQRVATFVFQPDPRSGSVLRKAVLQKLNLAIKPQAREVPRLIAEFTPELKLLGTDTELLRSQIEKRLSPDPVTVPDTGVRSKEYEKGVKLARQEWKKGETVLYCGGLSPALTIDEKLGIPLYMAFGCLVDEETAGRAQGHNEEVYRLILERGLPTNSRVRWMGEILQPKQLWADPTRTRTPVPYGGPALTSPDSNVTLRLREGHDEQPPRLEISEKDAKPFRWDLHQLDRQSPVLTALWGPPGSHLLFLRYREGRGGHGGEVFQVVDTALGRSLNRIYVPEPASNQP